MEVTPSSLHSMGVEALATRALSIHKEATTRLTQLAPLNVTQANVGELKTKLDAFNESKEGRAPRWRDGRRRPARYPS